MYGLWYAFNMKERTGKNNLVPLYASRLACGLFGISEDFVEEHLSLDQRYIKHPNSTFFIRASGDSMNPKIEDGDILVVDSSLEPGHNSIVAVHYNGNPLCKKLVFRYPQKRLVSLNLKYKPILVSDNDQLDFFGVVTAVIKDL